MTTLTLLVEFTRTETGEYADTSLSLLSRLKRNLFTKRKSLDITGVAVASFGGYDHFNPSVPEVIACPLLFNSAWRKTEFFLQGFPFFRQ